MVYNSRLKIMKKLFYSFVVLASMCLIFSACGPVEPEDPKKTEDPKVESNCILKSVETKLTELGQVYYFKFTTNDVEPVGQGFQGTGEYLEVQLYANPQDDLFPTEKTYQVYTAEEIKKENFSEKEFVHGGSMIPQGVVFLMSGTICASVENGKNTDIFLCVDGSIEFKGDTQNGTMIANLEFVNSNQKENSITKQFIYCGAFDIQLAQ